MYRIAVLHDSPKPTWTSRRLLQAIRELGHKPLYLIASYLTITSEQQCPLRYRGKCLNLDAIIVRSLGRSLNIERFLTRIAALEYLESQGILVVNPTASLRITRDKASMFVRLAKHGIRVPATVMTENPLEALRVIREWGKVVIKPVVGSLGLGSFYVDDVDTGYRIVSLLASLNQPIYMQKYIEKKGNRDIRVFIVDEEVVAAIYRIAPPGMWKTNIAQGAKPVACKPSEEVKEIAIRAAKALGLYYTGVDLAESIEGVIYVFEANASPLWRGLYRATGVDPSRHIVSMIIRKLKK